MNLQPLTPLEMFFHWEKNCPEKVFLRQPVNDHWHTWTYAEAGQEIRKVASYLLSLDLPQHSNIAILSKNCAHWIMADLAIWAAGHISVPFYPTISADSISHLLSHSGAQVLFIGKLDDFFKQRSGVPAGINCINFSFYNIDHGTSWNNIVEAFKPVDHPVIQNPDSIATIKYTSGTTGIPKGVMITFNALRYVTPRALEGFHINAKDNHSFFSYLPLSHIAERMLVEMGALYTGATITFSESLEKFAKNLTDTQPTVFLAVPRIWAKFKEKIVEKMPKLELMLKVPVLNSVVKKVIQKKLGLSNTQWIFTGAAPISQELLEWYHKLGIEIHDVYGMTENLAYSHLNLHEIKFGTVGKPWPDVQVKFSEEGEIQLKHGGLMSGYFREPLLTREAFTSDGYLRTGDKGEIDKEGFLIITGRVKDQFKTDKAKYVDPSPIELKLSSNFNIEQICVVGTGVPQPIALVILSEEAKAKSKQEIIDSISSTLRNVNYSLESYEKLAKVVILKEDWTIENGLMTPSLKVKRNELEKLHLPKYPAWYERTGEIIWE